MTKPSSIENQESSGYHKPVMLTECIEALLIKPEGIYVDVTFGGGGHSMVILENLREGRLIAFDQDDDARKQAENIQSRSFTFCQANFRYMKQYLKLNGVNQVDGILADLGISSHQIDSPERGFSTRFEGPLDMRMDTSKGLSAAQWLAIADEQDITQVIKELGEEKFGKRIAHGIVNARAIAPIETTLQLAAIIDEAVPVKDKFKHPATRSFQAIRMYINSELDEIRTALKLALSILSPGGRLAVISFHSLEDRIVKRFVRDQSKGQDFPHGMPIMQAQIDASKAMKLIGKAIMPGPSELKQNVRSRSAVLRVAEKL